MSKNDNDIVVVSFARTAFDRFGGVTKNIPSSDLASWVIAELVKRSGLPSEAVDDVNLGQCILGEAWTQSDIIGRQALIKAGLREETISNNIDRACCSSTSALQLSWKNLMLGEAELSIAVGVDNMGRAPYYLPPERRWDGQRIGDMKLIDKLMNLGYAGFGVLAVDAGEVALEYGITREMQDEWAERSHALWGEADSKGYFKEEIFPVEISQGKTKPPIIFDRDQQPRPGTTVETLAKLPTANGSPTVTAGNAPGLNTGSAGVMVTTRKKAQELGLEPLATVLRVASIALKPRQIAVAPAPAIQKGLELTGLKLDDIKLIEINEAFAAMPLVATKILGDGDEAKIKKLRDITNVNGGAVAMGHPVGASGLRITMTLIAELRRRGGGYGVASICGGLAQGDAVILKVD
ncbi:thiolase family protein [Desulfosporosinus sp. BICA1-9]|uniref:thiolase family protein n=1 Tax=Desulfosporosinus sp. BICA1-9 TaxID=1531958 RepID=UPI00054BA76D|nr:thiolase family protein [Desulfosporosinus sp. BICA1-9]KJS47382.1 MAG: acetyl-CoA acetyltransferase [Peptococcaceae bacterium BRH_c23]KJS88524.1 MAG: acetyl-CoA acetyltransferase [Desulfosporosinus sp. BICA1-9]HBW35154.1 acetyl-CoA C-acyltransferase [Desulfosporosinus sp.]